MTVYVADARGVRSHWSQEHNNWLDWQCVNFQFEVLVWG